MSALLTPDICVVGAGSAGLTVAAGAASFGAEVVLIERGAMGGDCLNRGCVPSKALIAAAAHAQSFREAGRFGIALPPGAEPRADWPAVRAHLRGVIAAIAPNDSVERFEGLGVTVIEAEARFVAPDTVSAGGRLVRARRFVLATGSSPRIPAVPGLDAVPFLTNETVFDLDVLPGHLLVLGGGPVGIELAQAFRRLGSRVTVLQSGPALPREDPELSRVVLDKLRAEGVAIRENAAVSQAGRDADGSVVLTLQGGRVSGSHLLVAAGRAPHLDGLGLEAAGIERSETGIVVDKGLRTANRRVFAIGDAIGGPQFTHAAGQHGALVLRSILFRLPVRDRPDLIPRATYTDPPLGQVGLTQGQAREAGLDPTILAVPFAENDRAQTERRTDGLVKLVAGRGGRLLGAGIVGRGADEATVLFSLALSKRMGMRDLAGFVAPYPTIAEIGRKAATAYFRPYAGRGVVRATVSLLRRFG